MSQVPLVSSRFIPVHPLLIGRLSAGKRALTLLCLAATLSLQGCHPAIIRASAPSTPNSAVEMVAESERLDELMGAGTLKRDEIRKSRDLYARLVDSLRSRSNEQDGLEQIMLRRAEITLQLYEDLLPLAERRPQSRTEQTEISSQALGRMREYLRQSATLDQNVELLPTEARRLLEQGGGTLLVELMPPPPAARLVSAYRAGRFDLVTKEVEGAGPDVLERLEPEAAAAYALSLGAQQRYDEAIRVAEKLNRRPLLPEEILQLRYLEALWLLKRERQSQGVQVLSGLAQESALGARRLEGQRPVLAATLDELDKGTPRFREGMLEARLALAEGRYDQARAQAASMLEQEGSVETINLIEGFLRQLDSLETQAFKRGYDEVLTLSRLEGGASGALEALGLLEAHFPGAQFKPRTNLLRNQLETQAAAAKAQPAVLPVKVPVQEQVESLTVGGAPASTTPETGPSGAAASSAAPAAGVQPAVVPPELAGAAIPSAGAAPVGSVPDVSQPGAAGGAPPGAGADPVGSVPGGAVPAAGGGGGGGSSLPGESSSSAVLALAPPSPLLSDPTGQQKALEQGKSQITVGEYEAAVQSLAPLLGTPLEGEAAALQQKAIDLHVQRVRERVARDYVRAQQLRTDGEKLQLFGSIYATLKQTLEAYPTTTLRSKAEHNLRVIESELLKLDPKFFEKQKR